MSWPLYILVLDHLDDEFATFIEPGGTLLRVPRAHWEAEHRVGVLAPQLNRRPHWETS